MKSLKVKIRTKEQYQKYLSGSEFRQKRLDCAINQRGICWWCKDKLDSKYVAHHRRYSRLGREKIGKCLVACCSTCHSGYSKAHRDMHKNIQVPDFAKINPNNSYNKEREGAMLSKLVKSVVGFFIKPIMWSMVFVAATLFVGSILFPEQLSDFLKWWHELIGTDIFM